LLAKRLKVGQFFQISQRMGGKLFLFSRRILETCFFIGQRVAASFLLAKEYWRTVFYWLEGIAKLFLLVKMQLEAIQYCFFGQRLKETCLYWLEVSCYVW
jgi:hypothetical protein